MTIRIATALLAVVLAAAEPVLGQGAVTAPLSGTVVDTSGGVLPGADVVVRNDATGATYTTVTNEQGIFTIPALNPGRYTVTVSLAGFKTVTLNDVEINAGVPAAVRAVLEVGQLQETVTVEAASSLVQTQTAAVATTLTVTQVSNLPLTSRNTLDFVPFLPGVNTPGGNRDSTINGLPQSAINITLDGMNIQDNHLKTTDGFFARLSPRLDAVEEVTVATAAQGAEATGQGAVQIRFVTRSGTNDFRGSVYHYYRDDALRANTWFNKRNNLPKPELLQNQPGFRVGGPLSFPGLWSGRNRAFYFVNYEEFRQPQDISRNRTILHPRALAGFFRYNVTVGGQTQVREVNVLDLAARHGHLASIDPTIGKVLADIQAAVTGTGTVTDLTDPLFQRFSFLVPQRAHNRYPTGRLDFNLNSRHRLTASLNYQHILSTPDTLNGRDPIFPGFPVTGRQDSHRYTTKGTLRSTLSSNLVNEFAVGATGGPTYFSNELNPGMWGGTPVADQGGYHLNFNGALGISNPASGPTPSAREASTKIVENTLSWLRGAHSFSFGGVFTQADVWLRNQTLVPTINFGIVTGDPADAMFTTANFPGASNTDLNRARALYAVLVGRISSITANARIDEQGRYQYLGPSLQRGRLRELDLFMQDAWRVRPDLTLNLGLRYVLQTPFYPLNDSYSTATMDDVCGISGRGPIAGCNLFQPGVLAGRQPVFVQYPKGQYAYRMDKNNWAPSVGVAWTPTADDGFWRAVLGRPGDTVLRGGFAMAYNREGMSNFTDIFGANPGLVINVDRSLSLGNLGPLPLLFRDRGRLAPPSFPEAPQYPLTDVVTGDVAIFAPDLRVPWTQSWSAGIQRALSTNMAVEVRYVGTRHRMGWETLNYNEINILENGFLEEFRRAQANLQANLAAGRGATFAYFGPGTGTSPLPIFLAYFSGLSGAAANSPASYTSTLFRNTTFVNPLAIYNPRPYSAAASLFSDATRRANALRAGLPPNFFVANPDLLGGAFVRGNGGATRFHGMQVELRRRMSGGLQFQASYAYGITGVSTFTSFRKPRLYRRDAGDEGEVTHAVKANWVYELPFGRGRRFASTVGPVLDRLIGGWSISGTARIQTGQLVNLGNVRLVGMTVDDVRKMFRTRIDESRRVWLLPQDVIDNTVRAFSVSATSPTGYGPLGPPSGRYFAPANGPDCIDVDGDADNSLTDEFGDCGVGELVVRGPVFQNYDLSIVKRVPIKGRVDVEFRLEALNVFNNVNFEPVGGLGSDPDDFEVLGLLGQDVSRTVQLIWRVSW
ncbi:MAG TPA: TonB-dependent receptor [Vicinamibacterales bacterium]|nr:TonB-dependent receptor [Vicinamibacterales bacterium]